MLLQPLGQKLAVNFLYLSPTFNILPFFEAYSVIPPPVIIIADEKRLKAGEPAPDGRLLEYDLKKFEDSPSGIRTTTAAQKYTTIAATAGFVMHLRYLGEYFCLSFLMQIVCPLTCNRYQSINVLSVSFSYKLYIVGHTRSTPIIHGALTRMEPQSKAFSSDTIIAVRQ